MLGLTHQGSYVEATVAQKLNQGTVRQKGCNLLSGSFFGSFLDKQKRTYKSKYICTRNKKQEIKNKESESFNRLNNLRWNSE